MLLCCGLSAGMDLTNSVGGIEKLNNTNYDYWKSCMESYLQGQDLWEVVSGTDVVPPNGTLSLKMVQGNGESKPGRLCLF